MSKLFRKILKSYIIGGLFGLVCGYVVFLVINRFIEDVHLEAFPVILIGAVLGISIGYGVGLHRNRCFLAAAPEKERQKVLGIGFFCGFLVFASFFVLKSTKARSSVVNNVRQISNEQVVEIVFSTARPYYKPLARIRDPNFIKVFTDKLASAEIYSPNHDSFASEGHVKLVLRYGRELDWEWFTPKRDPSDGILDSLIRVPDLGPLLTNGPKQAR